MIEMSEDSDFSLDYLVVEDKEVPPPIVLSVSVVISETEYAEQTEDTKKLRSDIETQLINNYAFAKAERRRYKQGFLNFEGSEDIIKCIYARETPTRIDFELDDLKIHTKRIRYISPSFRVRVIITINKEKATVVLFGGDDKTVARALSFVNICIRKCIKGGHKTYETRFSQEEMVTMLENFGEDIQYVYIAPGDNERLRKVVERREKGEIRKIRLYSVYTKFLGFKVVASPVVLGLIREEGIRIREIEGRFKFAAGISITTRVSVGGRILFYIPENLIGRKESAYEIAERLYKKIITQRTERTQRTMEEFFPGAT